MTIFIVWAVYFGLLASQQQKHKLGIAEHGITKYHRKTFNSSLQLDLRFQK